MQNSTETRYELEAGKAKSQIQENQYEIQKLSITIMAPGSGTHGRAGATQMITRNVWRLRVRPNTTIQEGDLEYRAEPLEPLTDGQVLIRTIYISLDPANRTWLTDEENYLPPVELGAPMRGLLAGRVIESRKAGVVEGAVYAWIGEWTDLSVTKGDDLQELPELPGISLATTFGLLSLVGPTAYFGLLDIGKPKVGETLVVSSAAGGVGQVVGQIGKLKGCHVIGIAGGQEKCDYIVNELGFDAAIDYKAEDVGDALDRLAPSGVDINFEQVGGPIMDAVVARMKRFGRVIVSGMISQYNQRSASGIPLGPVLWIRRLLVQGFLVLDYLPRYAEAQQELGGWLLEGKLRTRVDVRVGLENAVTALKDLYSGGNFGKLLLEVSKP